jgi:hypothetical protein
VCASGCLIDDAVVEVEEDVAERDGVSVAAAWRRTAAERWGGGERWCNDAVVMTRNQHIQNAFRSNRFVVHIILNESANIS